MKKLIITVVSIKIIVIIFAIMADQLLYDHPTAAQVNFTFEESNYPTLQGFGNWDGQWYLSIAENGYSIDKNNDKGIIKHVFFPAYPLLIAFLGTFTIDHYLAGIIISTISSVGASIVLYKLVKLDFSAEVANLATLLFAINPVSIFYSSVYTEALFMLFALSAVYFTRKKRWLLAAFYTALVTATRVQGVLIIPYVLLEYVLHIRKATNPKKALYSLNTLSLLIMPAGILTFFTYSFYITGMFDVSVYVAQYFGNIDPGIRSLGKLVYTYVVNFHQVPIHSYSWSRLDFIAFILMLGSIFKMARSKQIRPTYIFLALTITLLPMLSGTTAANLRYYSLSFPHYIWLALYAYKSEAFRTVLLFTFAALSALFTIMFINWYWVA